MSQRFSHLVFDLDDTILDTTGVLIPQASAEACAAMIEAGLKADVASCVRVRTELAKSGVRNDVFSEVARHFGVKPSAQEADVARIGSARFYNRKVDPSITLIPAAREMLRDLQSRYGLHLVTAGDTATQKAKINALKLHELFDTISVVDTHDGTRKGDAFLSIQNKTGAKPEAYLSIGNRLDAEIADAKKLHWMTCWVRYGEHSGDHPRNEFEKPDFNIESIEELIAACRL